MKEKGRKEGEKQDKPLSFIFAFTAGYKRRTDIMVELACLRDFED